MEGPERCQRFEVKYYYDYNTQQCSPFYWRGCNGNNNNFATYDECMGRCRGVSAPSQNLISTTQSPYVPQTRPPYVQPTPTPQTTGHTRRPPPTGK